MGVTANDVIKTMQSFFKLSKKEIIDIYNSHTPLAMGYKMKYTDFWCDAAISAVFIKLGAVDLIGGTECGVERHIQLFKAAGIWEEDGSVTPTPGAIICYNWDDSTQPNDGFADHIGIIEKVENGQITTMEGNMNDAMGHNTIPVGYGFIRGYAFPRYAEEGKTEPKPAKQEAPVIIVADKPLNGIDIASYQAAMDTETIPGDFVIVKATQGTGYINPYFRSQIDGVIKSGKIPGLYHYANGAGSMAETNFFLQTAQDYLGKVILCLDWETSTNTAGRNAAYNDPAYAKAIMDEVKKRIGATMFIYGSKLSCFAAMDWSEVAKAGYPLWGAQYKNNNSVNGYASDPWQSDQAWGAFGQNLAIHQYTSNLILPGYNGRLDGDICYLSREQLLKFMKADTAGEEIVVQPAKKEPLDKASLLELVARTMQGDFGINPQRKKELGNRYKDVQAMIDYIYKTDTATLATEAMTGKYGSGDLQKQVLAHRYNEVMAAMNNKMNTMKSIGDVAKEIIHRTGGWGDDPERTQKLRAAGYDSMAVQKEVNRLMGVYW